MANIYRRNVRSFVDLRIPRSIAERAYSGVATAIADHHDNVYQHSRLRIDARQRSSTFSVRLTAAPAIDVSIDDTWEEFVPHYGTWRYVILSDLIDAFDSVVLSPIVAPQYRWRLEEQLRPRAAHSLYEFGITAELVLPVDDVREPPVAALFRRLPKLASLNHTELELHY